MLLKEAVQNFLTGYFATHRRSEKTRIAYRTDLKQLELYIGSEWPIHSVTAESLESWARMMRSSQYATVSIRRKFATVRLFFSYLTRKSVLESSPISGIRLDLRSQRMLPRALTARDTKLLIEEVWRTLNQCPKRIPSPRDPRFLATRNIAIIEILFATGMRVGELVGLSVRDWHEEESLFVVMGKGGRQRLALIPDNRSRSAIRTYLAERSIISPSTDALFVNPSGRRLSPQGVSRVIRIVARQAGLEIHVTPHMLRHTVATLLLRCGADIRIVQEVLGHASIVTTQRYTYVSKEHLLTALHAHHPNNHLRIDSPPRELDNQLMLPLA